MEKIYFIRHKFKELSPVIETYCRENSCVAIHFNNEFHSVFSAYSMEAQKDKGFKSAFTFFQKLGESGGIVVTEYCNTEFYIGEVSPDTTIEGFNYGKENGGKDDYYKTLKLRNVKGPFPYADYPLVSALRPPFVTICGLNDFSRNIILHLYRNAPLALDVTNLHPMLLEQMCEEWLRSELAGKLRIKFNLLKTGKTLPTIDIYARTFSGNDILVQVTHAREKAKVLAKATKLEEYLENRNSSKQTVGLFFAPAECERYLANLCLTFISVESVFSQFTAVPDYREMLRNMIGIHDQGEENLVMNIDRKVLSIVRKLENLVTKTNRELLEYGSLRQLLDSSSDEWKRITQEQRVLIWQHLLVDSKITVDELKAVIEEYAHYYDSIGKSHVIKNVTESLLENLKSVLSNHILVKK